jgi:hypothetical protein
MATLMVGTFPADDEGRGLLRKVRQSLTNLCGQGHGNDGTYTSAPRRLNAERDMLRENYREIWKEVTIQYSADETGASVNHRTKIISIGGFFLRPSHKVLDIQKVLLHEFLHLAIDMEMREFHHGQIEQIIKYNLGYEGDANPFGTD